MNKHRKFKNILINPRYQIKFVVWLTSSGIALIVLYSALFYSYTRENYAILVELSPMDDTAKQQLYSELHHIILFLAVISFLFLLMVSVLGVILSHRTAGPMFQFKRVFNEVKEGNSGARIRLRPSDEFRDVATAFNEMMDKMTVPEKKQ